MHSVEKASLRVRRSLLLENNDLGGIEFCHAYSRVADEWLFDIASEAGGAMPRKVALLAVGGYGRGELCPSSDLDLVLVHDGWRRIDLLADQLWYPVWDEGVGLDHSVRKPKEVLLAAEKDLRVALGLLDARLVWGDATVAGPLIDTVRHRWAGDLGDRWLPELEHQMAQRHEQYGDLADLLEPDLKEAHGGLRDINVLHGIRLAFPHISELLDFDAVAQARDVLLEARVGLHAQTGREQNRLLLQEQDQVARRTGDSSADVLMQRLSAAARVVARTSDVVWRRRSHWRESGKITSQPDIAIEPGIIYHDGEIDIDDSVLSPDLVLRLAAVSAERDVPIAMSAVTRLAREGAPVAQPWSDEVLAAFKRLLSARRGLVSAIEALEVEKLFTNLLPEWHFVRNYHQRNAYHRFTVDRHLLEAVRNANDSLDTVGRPDLLLMGALFHDIGKGHPGDHTAVGIELVHRIGTRIGLPQADIEVLAQLVRHHLLLADSATRRDLDDEATIRHVAACVGNEETLNLLVALSRADGLATGPSAWGAWKSGLVDDLASKTRALLGGDVVARSPRALGDIVLAAQETGLAVRRDGDWIVVASLDRPRLLATLAGTLALLGVDIKSADVHSEGPVALDRFCWTPGPRGWPSEIEISEEIERSFNQPEKLFERLNERARTYATKRQSAHPVGAGVHVLPQASDTSTVIEIRALDEHGLLSRVAQCIANLSLDVVAARLSTVGDIAIDTFYLRTADGQTLGADALRGLCAELAQLIDADL